MRTHTIETNNSVTMDERYKHYLAQFSNISKKILSRLNSHKNPRKILIQKIYPDEICYTEIQNIINELNKYYETPEVSLSQKKLDDLIQLVALLNEYVSRENSSSSMRSIGYKKSEKIAVFKVMTQLAVAMFFMSTYLYQFAFVSQAALLAANIFIINASFLGIIAIIGYMILVYAKNDSKTSNLLSRLSEKLSPYKDILCRTSRQSSEENSCTDNSKASFRKLPLPLLSMFTTNHSQTSLEEWKVSSESSLGSLSRRSVVIYGAHSVPSSVSSNSTPRLRSGSPNSAHHLLEQAALLLCKSNSIPTLSSSDEGEGTQHVEEYMSVGHDSHSISIIEATNPALDMIGLSSGFQLDEGEYVIVDEISTDDEDRKSPSLFK